MPTIVTLDDDVVAYIAVYQSLRRVACGNPQPGDYDNADVDPADWEDHVPGDEAELFEAADDLATYIIDCLAGALERART